MNYRSSASIDIFGDRMVRMKRASLMLTYTLSCVGNTSPQPLSQSNNSGYVPTVSRVKSKWGVSRWHKFVPRSSFGHIETNIYRGKEENVGSQNNLIRIQKGLRINLCSILVDYDSWSYNSCSSLPVTKFGDQRYVLQSQNKN